MAREEHGTEFRILTFNVGLLRLLGIIEPAPFVRERARSLPSALASLDVDVIALQEIYDEPTRRAVIAGVSQRFPFFAYSRAGRGTGLENGLMTLSRVPMVTAFELFDDGPWDERLFDHKGLLSTAIRIGDHDVRVVNVHTTAGGLFSRPEDPPIDQLRERQLSQVLRATREPARAAWLVVGDLNAGPGVSPKNYELFERNGFVDVDRHLNGENASPTWEPTNPLNVSGPHRASPAQRIDHIMIRREDLDGGRVLPRVCGTYFREPSVKIPGGEHVTLSDHYGILAEFELRAPV